MTGSALMSLVLLSLTAAVSPFSLIAFSLVLATDRGPKNGIAFILGWIVTVTGIGVVMIFIGDGVSSSSSSKTPGKAMLALELALGVVLVLMWLKRRYRPRTGGPETVKPAKPEPAWQRKIATMKYPGAFVAGGLVQTWPVMIAAGAEIAQLKIGNGLKVSWAFVFAVSTTAGIVVLEILAWRNPGSAAARLDQIRNHVDNHRDAVMNWLFLLAGLWLFFRGLLGLV